MLWVILNHCNNIMFKNYQPAPIAIIEQARHTYPYCTLYSKNINMDFLSHMQGLVIVTVDRRNRQLVGRHLLSVGLNR